MLIDLPQPAYMLSLQQENRLDRAQSFAYLIAGNNNPSGLTQCETRLEELYRMPAGWDGYGALPISSTTKYNALQALRGIIPHAPTPDITPNPNGTISYEWETDRGVAHLEIGQTRLSFYIELVSGEPVLLDSSCENLLVASIRIGLLVSSNLFPLRFTLPSITSIRWAANVSSAY